MATMENVGAWGKFVANIWDARRSAWSFALTVAGLYALAAGLWILVSDSLVYEIAPSPAAQAMLQTYKGWLFVAVTAILLAMVLQAAWHATLEAKDEMRKSRDRLELALSSAGGGVWDRDLVNDAVFISPQLKRTLGFDESFPDDLEVWGGRIHPDDLEHLRDSTRRAIAGSDVPVHDVQYRIRGQDGNYRWVHSRARILRDSAGRPSRMIGIGLDVTAQVDAREQIARLKQFDPLTGLANRATFCERLEAALAAADGGRVAVLRLLPDRYHEVGDRFGQAAGDRTLQALAERLRRVTGPDDVLGYLGGEEFALALVGRGTDRAVQRAVKAVAAVFDEPFVIEDCTVDLSASLGAAVFPNDAGTAEKLLGNAGMALNQARASGGARARFFAAGMDEAFRLRAQRAQDLRRAAERGELELHYQPIVQVAGGRPIGFEALVRWRRPAEGLVRPDEFIGLAEELGYIRDIGRWVLEEACREARAWQDGRVAPPYVAVNVSRRQFDDPDFLDIVRASLAKSGLPPGALEIEVTESALAQDPETARRHLEALRSLGIAVAIDDFGTGYSSLAALERLPLSRLKVDKSFVGRYGARDRSTAILDSILDLAATFDLAVTAEGVETAEQLAMLRDKGVQAAQGYYFSRPVPRDRLTGLLDSPSLAA